MADRSFLVPDIRVHAEAHRNEVGWDVVSSCWSDQEIENSLWLWQVCTLGQAIAAFEKVFTVYGGAPPCSCPRHLPPQYINGRKV
jgi:hypothetical protein